MAAQNTYSSSAGADDVNYLASMGTYGKDEQNIARDLISKFCKGTENPLPEPYIASLPVLVNVRADCEKRVEFKDFHLFLPQWFALTDAPDHIWKTLFGISDIANFWAGHSLAEDPKNFLRTILLNIAVVICTPWSLWHCVGMVVLSAEVILCL